MKERHLSCTPLRVVTLKEKRVIGFDIETHGEKNEFVLASFVSDDMTYIARSKAAVVEFLNRKENLDAHFVATNLGFDFLGVFGHQREHEYSMTERNGILYSFTYYQFNNKKKPIRFYDTIRFFPVSVAVLGKITGVAKMEHPSCFGKMPTTDADWQQLEAYCINDAKISQLFFQNFVLKYLKEHGLRLKTTIASTALNDWRTNYLDEPLYVEGRKIHDCCFKAYYGGRTEVFRRGTFKDITCYDFNSLYPSVMLEELPHPNHSYHAKKISMYDILNREGVAHVEGWQKPTFIPLLPQRIDDKLMFTCGNIKGYYTFVEIREALKNGFSITWIGEGVYYTKTKPFFRKFVEEKYATRLKQKANKDPMEVMTKLIMNSLYGKFGFNYKEKSTIVMERDLTKKVVDEANCIIELEPGIFSVNSENGSPPCYSFPILACYITALARLKLYRTLKKHQSHILYCDTDSVFFANNYQIPSSNALGDLKEEYTCPEGIFVRPKFYYTTTAKVKGVKIKLDKKRFMRIIAGEEFNEPHFIKLRSSLRSKATHKYGKLHINQIIEKPKKLNIHDTKRKWNEVFLYHTQETSQPFLFED